MAHTMDLRRLAEMDSTDLGEFIWQNTESDEPMLTPDDATYLMVHAAWRGATIVNDLIRLGADPNGVVDGVTALHEAIIHDSINLADIADVADSQASVATYTTQNALQFAASSIVNGTIPYDRGLAIVKILLMYGANPYAPGEPDSALRLDPALADLLTMMRGDTSAQAARLRAQVAVATQNHERPAPIVQPLYRTRPGVASTMSYQAGRQRAR